MAAASLKSRLRAGEQLIGTFVKSASYQTVEVLGSTGLDFIVIDAEHAPFDRQQLDITILAARAAGIDSLVRLPNTASDTILNVLDVGASGLLVPHALSADGVRAVVSKARYRQGERGFSNSPRAGRYGLTAMNPLVDAADAGTSLVFQIEDKEAVERIDEIAALDDVDMLFIGRADLAVSYGTFDLAHADVARAVETVCRSCRAARKPVGIFLADTRDVGRFRDMGVSMFVIGSDQSLLRAQTDSIVNAFRQAS
jgi:2-keto-3-deoxy-L-rhamnonate aldolase RhmA